MQRQRIGKRHWKTRDDPPVQFICINAARKVASGSVGSENRPWPTCLAMTAPALVLLPSHSYTQWGSSERSSEGCKSRDAQPSAVSVSSLAWGSCVGIQAICSIKFQKEATLLYHIGYGRAAFKENFMNANVNYCSVIILLRQLVTAGHCTKKEANRIAARIAKKTGADLILSI